MKQSLCRKIKQLIGGLKSINSFCSLYEEVLKKNIEPNTVDDLIIESKELFLKFENIYNSLISSN